MSIVNPYQDRLDEYLGFNSNYRTISDIPIEPRMFISELILRRNLCDIENGIYYISSSYKLIQSTSLRIAARLMKDTLETIEKKHCL